MPVSNKPTTIGDLIDVIVTYTAPTGAAPGTKVTAAQLLIQDPAGQAAAPVDGVELSANVWRFTAATRITTDGVWHIRVNANAGLIDSLEISLNILPSHFTAPLPP